MQFDEYGAADVLKVAEVPQPVPGPGQVLVHVRAAGINPGETKIREGLLHSRWPATFPSGEGSDLAGVVEQVGPEVTGVALGDEVIGWVDTRSSHAEYAVVQAASLAQKPGGVPWEVAGALPVAGFTAWAAVRAVALTAGDTLVVAGGPRRRGWRARPGRTGRPDRGRRAGGAYRRDIPAGAGPRSVCLPRHGSPPRQDRPAPLICQRRVQQRRAMAARNPAGSGPPAKATGGSSG